MLYYDFNSSIRFNLSWNALKYKNEYKINSNEFSLYQLLSDEVALVALKLEQNLDHNLCEALARVHGFIFCPYGYAGWNAIKEHLIDNNIEFDLEKAKIEILVSKIKSVRVQADEEFVNYAKELFIDSASRKEIKLVKECYRVIKALQPHRNKSTSEYFDLVESALEELIQKSKEINDIATVDLAKYIPSGMQEFTRELEDKDKEEFLSELERNIDEIDKRYPEQSLSRRLTKAISNQITF